MITRKIAHYGWKPSLPDSRDRLWANTLPGQVALKKPLPLHVDLRDKCPPVYDQGELGSCTANGVGALLEYEQMRQGDALATPSRLFIYYGERAIEGSVSYDSGAQVRDGLKVVSTLGAPPETLWPYDIARFTQKPPTAAYTEAAKHKALRYHRVFPNGGLRASLAAGLPFTFGFTVYESFESEQVAETGVVPMPKSNEQIVGGHCVVAVGYDTPSRRFIVRNSWGDGWGDKGYCYLPWAFFTMSQNSLASDIWNIELVS